MTTLERAAKALHSARMARQHPKPENFPWEALSNKEQALLRVDAHVVIAAIREPSATMLAVDPTGPTGSFFPEDVWRAMIDAALDE